MIGLNNLKPARGSRHRRKILGRGEGSGHGGSSTKGMKGQTSRSGDGKMTGFEGGQMPLVRRTPKRGFTNKFRKDYEVINIETIETYFESGTEINKETLKKRGLIAGKMPLKILATGDLKKKFTIKANAFSKAALDKLKAAGSTAEVVKK